jgi:eukaryotic-like serine/threonine-protein kinase
LDRDTGNVLWKSEDLGGAMPNSPALSADGTLYVGTFKPEMVALDSASGRVIWRGPKLLGWVWATPLLQDGVLYFGDLEGEVFALNASDGSQRWRIQPSTDTNRQITGTPVLMGDTLYFSSNGGVLYAVDPATGTTRWSKAVVDAKNTTGQIYANLLAVNDMLLVAPNGLEPVLIALDAAGNQKWAFIPAK